MGKFVDLSHTIKAGMQLFSPTAPQPEISPWLSHEQAAQSGNYQDCSCEITHVSFVTSIGTYLDSPYHFHPNLPSIDQLTLDQLIRPGVVINCTHIRAQQPIMPDVLNDIDIEGKAVLFHTGWSRYWGQPEYYEFPFLTKEMAIALRDGGAKLVGVDFLVVDDLRDATRPGHVTLLKEQILIVENLTNLTRLPSEGFTFHAIPTKIAQAAAFPVRAFATL